MSEEFCESRKQFFTALAAAQAELGGAKKDSTNPHFKNRYADLESVWDAWRSVGTKHGFSVIQHIHDALGANGVRIETVLGHAGGYSVSSTMFVPASKGDAQGYGSAITYGRRYALASVVGIVQTDDDGEAARVSSQAAENKALAKKAEIDAAFKAKDLDALRAMATDTAVQSDKRLSDYVSAIIGKLESK